METGKLGFKDVTKKRGLWFRTTPRSFTDNSAGPYYGFQPVSWDIDEDGWPDIFVTNDSVSNLCWLNKQGKRFEDGAQAMGLAMSASDYNPQASMGVAVGDLNNDGRFDLIVSEFSHDQSNLLTAERLPNGMVVFNEKAVKTGFRDLTFFKLQWGTTLYDMDLDGDLDMYICCGHVYPEVDQFKDQQTSYRQTNLVVLNADPERLKLVDVSNRAGPGLRVTKVSRAAVAVDLDDDGDLDIITSELNDRPTLLRLDIDRARNKNHWLMIHLVGDPAARIPMDPVGAIVNVTAGKLHMSRVRMIGSSFQSCEDPRLHFGLGPSAVAEKVEVRWPNGKTTVLENVAADRHIEIRYASIY